jgi:hypothetical protein
MMKDGAISSKDSPKRSCRQKASRSAEARVSSTTRQRAPDHVGVLGLRGKVGHQVVGVRRSAPRRGPRAGRLASAAGRDRSARPRS